MIKTAIIVLNYNDSKRTLDYIKQIQNYNSIDYIVVVDNASSDIYLDALKEFCDNYNVDFVPTKENKGYSFGNNAGVNYAISKYHIDIVIVSNPDIICKDEDITKIKKELKDKNVGVATGLIYCFDRRHNPKIFSGYAYDVPQYKDMLMNCSSIITKICKDYLKRSIYYGKEDAKRNRRLEVGCVSGCFFTIKREAYEAMNGFDEELFLYYEESVIGYRMKELGYKVIVRTDTPIYHDENPHKLDSSKKYWIMRSYRRESSITYLNKYLKVGLSKTLFYQMAFFIGSIEQYILFLIRK